MLDGEKDKSPTALLLESTAESCTDMVDEGRESTLRVNAFTAAEPVYTLVTAKSPLTTLQQSVVTAADTDSTRSSESSAPAKDWEAQYTLYAVAAVSPLIVMNTTPPDVTAELRWLTTSSEAKSTWF